MQGRRSRIYVCDCQVLVNVVHAQQTSLFYPTHLEVLSTKLMNILIEIFCETHTHIRPEPKNTRFVIYYCEMNMNVNATSAPCIKWFDAISSKHFIVCFLSLLTVQLDTCFTTTTVFDIRYGCHLVMKWHAMSHLLHALQFRFYCCLFSFCSITHRIASTYTIYRVLHPFLIVVQGTIDQSIRPNQRQWTNQQR